MARPNVSFSSGVTRYGEHSIPMAFVTSSAGSGGSTLARRSVALPSNSVRSPGSGKSAALARRTAAASRPEMPDPSARATSVKRFAAGGSSTSWSWRKRRAVTWRA